ncbi:MAG: DUF1819 domain-containing protein [Bradymonadaceae bacterium]
MLKFALGVEPSRDYWQHVDPADIPVDANTAFEERWFGNATESRVRIILTNMRVRYDAYPPALEVLSDWGHTATPDVRRLISHWHLQLADPMYRQFTAGFLVRRRRNGARPVARHHVVDWVDDQQPDRWSNPTLVQWASKLLSASADAGLVDGKRGERALVTPDVPDVALSYLCHLLRQVEIEGDLLENPYLRSVGLDGRLLEDRLRRLDGVDFRRMGDLLDFQSTADSLAEWREAIR